MLAEGCATGEAGSRSGVFVGRKGTPWTILCLELSGPARVHNVELYAETLQRTPGVRAQDVFHRDEEDGFARLYYGTYYRRRDPKTGQHEMPRQLRADLDLIKQLGGPDQTRCFLRAIPVRVPTPDVGNPQWRLADTTGMYSLQVAAFEPTDDFWEYKRAAAEFCELLRKEGLEAYYHHGSSGSVVTVGVFGPEAVVRSANGVFYDAEVTALQQHELLKHNLVNGHIMYVRDPAGGKVAVPSRLVEIPRSVPMP